MGFTFFSSFSPFSCVDSPSNALQWVNIAVISPTSQKTQNICIIFVQCWTKCFVFAGIELAAAPANFTAKTSCDQWLSVTNDFFCLAEARSLVTGSTVCVWSIETSLNLIKCFFDRCLVNPIIQYWRCLFFIIVNIFCLLELEIVLAVLASNVNVTSVFIMFIGFIPTGSVIYTCITFMGVINKNVQLIG